MKSSQAVCWKCGISISDWPLPLMRLDACTKCRADLHVCKMCEFFDEKMSRECREPVAGKVIDKERANFCGYFVLNQKGFKGNNIGQISAVRAQLEAIFGETPKLNDNAQQDVKEIRSPADIARDELEKLFSKPAK